METLLGANRAQVAMHVGESGEAAAARRQAAQLARRSGFDETRAGAVALVVTEAATNIEKHAGEGEILLQAVSEGDRTGIEVLALDKGPGMGNLAYSLQDGSSRVGTYGVGLGTMKRQSQQFDVFSLPGKGTVIRMVVWADEPDPNQRAPRLQFGAVCLPYPGETACGDTWMARFDDQHANFLVSDGLGHGPAAAHASAEAARVAASVDLAPALMVHRLDAALRGTRGAALAAAELDLVEGRLDFAGVGNIAASVCTGTRRHQLVSHNGIVGARPAKVQTFSTAWESDSIFIAHSDGLSTRWQLTDYPGLEWAHPGLIAAVLYRDHGRGTDDMTVFVARESKR